jgi:beta-lactamase regulating signal transducer with metallopeptidase domain
MNAPLWFSNLAFWSVQVALLILSGGLLLRVFQIQQPRIVLVYWRVLLAISLALPFIQPWHRPRSLEAITLSSANIGAPGTQVPDATFSFWHFFSLQLVAEILGIVILVGIATRFVILALGLLKLRQLRHDSSSVSPYPETTALLEQVRSQVNVRADFRLSPDVDSPVTFGFTGPMILLPQNFPSMDSRFQAAVACHELLHVCRRDWAQHLAEEMIRASFWFHPALLWLIGRMRLAREQVVDLEVVMLTSARKTYLKALLEFTKSRSCARVVPAPLFLAERQLAERIALMLKEVRMSKSRLILSLTAIACSIVIALTLGAWIFPLKGTPLAVWPKPIRSAIDEQSMGASVDRNSIWTDTVKRGSMAVQVRGEGTIVSGETSANSVARVTLPASLAAEVHAGQGATVNTRNGLVKAHVIQVKEAPTAEAGRVDLGFDGTLPAGVGADHPVDATIDIGELNNVLWINRPANIEANTSKPLFKIAADGTGAEQVNVKFGRASVQTIEILDGLKVGDKVILSDMSDWSKFERIHLK